MSQAAVSRLVRAGAEYLLAVPYFMGSLEGFAAAASAPLGKVLEVFDDLHALGSAILDYERTALHAVQDQILRSGGSPLEKLRAGFEAIGALLANDVVVRAAFRLATESREAFPERRLDPFGTWRGFVDARLMEAEHAGLLREDLDLLAARDMLVAAGVGTRDLILLRGSWDEAEAQLGGIARSFVFLIAQGVVEA